MSSAIKMSESIRFCRVPDADKKKHLSLLLLADEQENMIDRYLDRGDMYTLEDSGNVLAVCVVADEGGGTLEVKNLAVRPQYHRRGYGRMMIELIADHYRDAYDMLLVGTGESPLTLPFYERCGFVRSHTVKNFFTDHYDHPIVEDGVLLTDMVYLKRTIRDK